MRSISYTTSFGNTFYDFTTISERKDNKRIRYQGKSGDESKRKAGECTHECEQCNTNKLRDTHVEGTCS